MVVNIDLTYKEFIKNIEALKTNYNVFVASFFIFEAKQKLSFIKCFKRQIYQLKFEKWKKDRIWEYLNGDIDIEVLKKLTN